MQRNTTLDPSPEKKWTPNKPQVRPTPSEMAKKGAATSRDGRFLLAAANRYWTELEEASESEAVR